MAKMATTTTPLNVSDLSAVQAMQRAIQAAATQDWDQAIQLCDRVLVDNPRTVLALLIKGEAFRSQGQRVKAFEAFNAALSSAPPYANVPADLRPRIELALEFHKAFMKDYGAFVDETIKDQFGQMRAPSEQRMKQAIDIFLNRK